MCSHTQRNAFYIFFHFIFFQRIPRRTLSLWPLNWCVTFRLCWGCCCILSSWVLPVQCIDVLVMKCFYIKKERVYESYTSVKDFQASWRESVAADVGHSSPLFYAFILYTSSLNNIPSLVLSFSSTGVHNINQLDLVVLPSPPPRPLSLSLPWPPQ